METSIPQAVAQKRVLPQWMLESANQQHTHTTTTRASSYKKQKRSDSFYGHIKRRVPLQDVGNSNKDVLNTSKKNKGRDLRNHQKRKPKG